MTNNVELCMVPPAPSTQKMDFKAGKHFLMLQCTGHLFYMDKADWEKAKHILWWFNEDIRSPVNRHGIRFEEYVGIAGSRLTEGVEKYNFCRVCYV